MHNELINAYDGGINDVRVAFAGLTNEQLATRPIPGKWSTLEVLCHLADSETLFAERMKRILAEDRPILYFADPELFAPALVYQHRLAEVELLLIESTRRQMTSILRSTPPESFARYGVHSRDGLCTLEQVLTKAVTHLRHHLQFVHEKRQALGL